MYKLQKSTQTIFVEITPVLDTKWKFGLAGQLQKNHVRETNYLSNLPPSLPLSLSVYTKKMGQLLDPHGRIYMFDLLLICFYWL